MQCDVRGGLRALVLRPRDVNGVHCMPEVFYRVLVSRNEIKQMKTEMKQVR